MNTNSERALALAYLLTMERAEWALVEDAGALQQRYVNAATICQVVGRLREAWGDKPCRELLAINTAARQNGCGYAGGTTAHEHAYQMGLQFLHRLATALDRANIWQDSDDECRRMSVESILAPEQWRTLAEQSYPSEIVERIAETTMEDLDGIELPADLVESVQNEISASAVPAESEDLLEAAFRLWGERGHRNHEDFGNQVESQYGRLWPEYKRRDARIKNTCSEHFRDKSKQWARGQRLPKPK